MALVGDALYVANSDALVRFPYRTGQTQIVAPPVRSGRTPLPWDSLRPRALPTRFQRGMFVGQHGSWNRKPRSGYKVVFVPFEGGKPAGEPVDVLTGFVDEDGNAMGRPVGVAIDGTGALVLADDVGNVVWRVTPASAADRAARRSHPPDPVPV